VALVAGLSRTVLDGEAGEGTGEFNSDGTSSGGLCELFSSAGDVVLDKLVPREDEEIEP
jgi:hypothetical protein